MSFHFFLSATNSLHLLTPSTWRSLSTSSFHPFLCLPLLLVLSSSWAKIFLGILSSSILSRWPNHLILCPFIHFTILSPLLISSSSQFIRLFHSPFSCLGPHILLNIWRPHLCCGKTLNLAHVEITNSLQVGNIIAKYGLHYLTQASADILTLCGNKMCKAEEILIIRTSHLITTSTSLSETVRLVESILSCSTSGPFIKYHHSNTCLGELRTASAPDRRLKIFISQNIHLPNEHAWRNWGQPVHLTGDSKRSSPKWRQRYCRTSTQLVLPTVCKRSTQGCNGSDNRLLWTTAFSTRTAKFILLKAKKSNNTQSTKHFRLNKF